MPRALTTLIPEIFSLMTLTTLSSLDWTREYRGIPFLEIIVTRRIIKGARIMRMVASPLSIEKVTMKPPRRRIGALTPMVWELCIKDCRL